MSESNAREFGDVYKSERAEIRERRKKVDLAPSHANLQADAANDENQGQGEPIPKEESGFEPVVGLALSGGGIRSASVSLGMLQSLYSRGLLRHVDYVSTVSGGSYAGGLLSSSVLATADDKKKEIDWNAREEKCESKERLPFEPEESGQQPPMVQELAEKGTSLRRPIRFLSRQLWGLVTINLFIFSGLIAATSFAAWLFRKLDDSDRMIFLSQLGFQSDVARAFAPAVVLFLLWLFVQMFLAVCRWWRWNVPNLDSGVYGLLVVSVVMAFVALFATGDISLVSLQTIWHVSPETTNAVKETLKWVANGVLAILIAALLPMLRPSVLLRSGTNPKRSWERWTFSIVSYAVVFGVPVLFFWFFVNEDVSRHNESRPDQYTFSRIQIHDNEAFWRRVKREALDGSSDKPGPSTRLLGENAEALLAPISDFLAPYRGLLAPFNDLLAPYKGLLAQYTSKTPKRPSETLWQAVEKVKIPGVLDSAEKLAVDQLLEWDSEVKTYDRHESIFFSRWAQFAFSQLGVAEEFDDILAVRRSRSKLRQSITDAINENCLSDPSFFESFSNFSTDDAWQKSETPEWYRKPGMPETNLELYQHARQLKVKADSSLKRLKGPPTTLFQKHKELQNQIKNLDDESETVTHHQEAGFQSDLSRLQTRFNDINDLLRDVRMTNWALLEGYYGERLIRDPDTVFAIVVTPHDQDWRMNVCVISLLVFLAVGVIVNVNPTTLHGFYRDHLAKMWLVEHSDFGHQIPLRELATCSRGGPYHIINGALSLFGRRKESDHDKTASYSFTKNHCGAKPVGYATTGQFEKGHYDLASAIAVSGGALSPSQIDNILVALLLTLTNLRLGQWLSNPSLPRQDLSWPFPLRLMLSSIIFRPEDRRFGFVSDGGHDENTGLGALLQRRCRVIIACDSSQDELYEFRDFRLLKNKAESRYGIKMSQVDVVDGAEVEGDFDLDRLRPTKVMREEPKHDSQSGKSAKPDRPQDVESDLRLKNKKSTYRQSESHHLLIRIVYPDDELSKAAGMSTDEERTGYLVYIKTNLTGDEPFAVREHLNGNELFPHDPTLDQFYEPDRFHSYRALGHHMGDTVSQELFKDCLRAGKPGPWLAEWSPVVSEPKPPADVVAQVEELLEKCRQGDDKLREAIKELEVLGPHTAPAAKEILTAIVDDEPAKYGLKDLVHQWGQDAVEPLVKIICSEVKVKPDIDVGVEAVSWAKHIFTHQGANFTGALDALTKAVTNKKIARSVREELVGLLELLSRVDGKSRDKVRKAFEDLCETEAKNTKLRKEVDLALNLLKLTPRS